MPYEKDLVKRIVATACAPAAMRMIAIQPRAPSLRTSPQLRNSTGSRNSATKASSATTISFAVRCLTSWLRKYASEAHNVADRATKSTENRSINRFIGLRLKPPSRELASEKLEEPGPRGPGSQLCVRRVDCLRS